MTVIPIKKIQKLDPESGTFLDVYAVPSMAITTPQGKMLIPNPSGKEAALFQTLKEAGEAVRRAGFDYEFEGKKTYVYNEPSANSQKTAVAKGAKPLEAAIPILIGHLKDREATVVANAVYALGTIRAYVALETMTDILGHDDPGVRKNVAEAMARIGTSALASLRAAFEKAQASTHKNAPYIRLTVISAFVEMLEQPNGHVLAEQFLPMAVSALTDESWLVRSQAAFLIGRSAQSLEEEKARRNQQQQSRI